MSTDTEVQPARRPRRKVVKDIEDVFSDVRDEIAISAAKGDDHHTDWGNVSLLRSTNDDGVPGLDLAPEILQSLDWSEGLVEGLQFADRHTRPGTHVPSKRRRLRHVLNMLNHFMGMHPELNRLGVRDDIATLALALDSMNSGVVHPLLVTQGFNKPPDTKLDQLFRAYVVAFVTILMNADQTEPAQHRRRAGGYGMELAKACEIVAKELTSAKFLASRPSKDGPDFRSETVRRYYYRAHPHSEDRAAEKDPVSDRREALGQADSQAVSRLMNSFVFNATQEGEAMPPSEAYAMKVIRATLRHSTFRSLFAHKCA